MEIIHVVGIVRDSTILGRGAWYYLKLGTESFSTVRNNGSRRRVDYITGMNKMNTFPSK